MAKAPLMSTKDDFENEARLVQYLAAQLMLGRLALLIGSGVSRAFDLPTWDEFILKLYESKKEVPPQKRPQKQAQDFRLKYYGTDSSGFVAAMRTTLYENASDDFNALRGNATLAALGSLVMASKRGSASKVITFNWDNLLELFLEYSGFVTASVGRQIHWAESVDVSVLHPHGLIPFDSRAEASDPKEIIFDQRSFSTIVGNEALPWRQHLLSIMRTHTCLFVGLSADDQNLDSLLLRCQQEHAIVGENKNTAYWGVTFAEKADEGAAAGWEEKGVYYKLVTSYSDGLPSFLLGICQEAVRLRRDY